MLLSVLLVSGHTPLPLSIVKPPAHPGIENFSLEQLVVLENIKDSINRHLDWNIKHFIATAYSNGIDYYTLNKGFKCLYNLSFRNYRRSCRVTRAKEMLENGYELNQVSEKLGYPDIHILEKDFIRIENLSKKR